MFACPNCGAGLRFDIDTQRLQCDYCSSSVDVTEYHYEKSAKANEDYDVTVFTCPACGGEIESTENEIIQFCPFCGASDVLSSRVEGRKRPSRIIPFRKTKEDCMEAFRKKTKKALFAPKELRDPSFLEGFRGIYLPYWEYKVVQSAAKEGVSFEATKTSGGYQDTYRITVPFAGKIEGIQHDASSSFDDSIGEEIAPFGKESEQKEFEPGYLAGFFADTADVPSDIYDEKIRSYANERTKKELTQRYEERGFTVHKFPDAEEAFHTEIESADRILLPVWFLTWRRKDRVAYSVVNGETGKIAADIPVDIPKYLLCSLLLAIPIFFLLNLFLSATAPSAMTASGFLAALCGFIYFWNMRKLILRDTHAEDLGYRYAFADRIAREKKKGNKSGADLSDEVDERIEAGVKAAGKGLWSFGGFLKNSAKDIGAGTLIFIGILFLSFADEFDFSMIPVFGSWVPFRTFSSTCLFILSVLLFLLALWNGRKSGEKRMVLEALLPVAAMIVVIFVLNWNPVEDYIYYFGMLICLAFIAVTLTALIFRYNMLSTHPVPNFHDRKGGSSQTIGAPTGAALLVLLLAGALLAPTIRTFAWTDEESVVYTNEYTGYSAFIRDEEDLLTDEEEAELAEYMAPMTDYGNVMFLSADGDYADPVDYLDWNYGDWFYEDGTIFLIEMSNRQLRLENSGIIQDTITPSYSNSIMDNVYRMASEGDYAGCAKEVFYECTVLMDGGRIARPMKYICNALLALICALLVNYLAIRVSSGNRRVTKKELERAIAASIVYGGVQKKRIAHRKIESSSGGGSFGGGGGSFGGGGGGGGGGHSGGGHGF